MKNTGGAFLIHKGSIPRTLVNKKSPGNYTCGFCPYILSKPDQNYALVRSGGLPEACQGCVQLRAVFAGLRMAVVA